MEQSKIHCKIAKFKIHCKIAKFKIHCKILNCRNTCNYSKVKKNLLHSSQPSLVNGSGNGRSSSSGVSDLLSPAASVG